MTEKSKRNKRIGISVNEQEKNCILKNMENSPCKNLSAFIRSSAMKSSNGISPHNRCTIYNALQEIADANPKDLALMSKINLIYRCMEEGR